MLSRLSITVRGYSLATKCWPYAKLLSISAQIRSDFFRFVTLGYFFHFVALNYIRKRLLRAVLTTSGRCADPASALCRKYGRLGVVADLHGFRRLQIPWQQFGDAVDRMIGDAREHLA